MPPPSVYDGQSGAERQRSGRSGQADLGDQRALSATPTPRGEWRGARERRSFTDPAAATNAVARPQAQATAAVRAAVEACPAPCRAQRREEAENISAAQRLAWPVPLGIIADFSRRKNDKKRIDPFRLAPPFRGDGIMSLLEVDGRFAILLDGSGSSFPAHGAWRSRSYDLSLLRIGDHDQHIGFVIVTISSPLPHAHSMLQFLLCGR